ncbi:MAG: hypothetical protein GY833_02265 [Aestuariibacter sp.]|nr:hypothetical protein [Aestuariibacter sp.]
MTNAAFKLEDSGFTREQVDALSEFMDGSVATKVDIAELSGEIKEVRGELNNVRTELSSEIKEVRGELKADIERLDGKITVEIAELSGEIKEVRGEIKAQGARLDGRIDGLRVELRLHFWILTVIVAGIISLVAKTFFN